MHKNMYKTGKFVRQIRVTNTVVKGFLYAMVS